MGKTSTARSVLSKGKYELKTIKIAQKEYPYCYDQRKKWVVTGRYDKNECGGLDGVITNRDIMKVYINRIMKEVSPEVIVFEAVMYGNSFKFGKELSDLCKINGYDYVGVLLCPELQEVFENMYNRNGGKKINEEGLSQMWFGSLKAANKLIEAGVNVERVNPRDYEKEELYKIVEGAL